MYVHACHRYGSRLAGVILGGRRRVWVAVLPAATRKRWKSSDPELILQRIRNLGILAHIDAGKTTTTERMLYYSGVTHRMGDVDSGDTVTDYLEQERERGITITSAAVTFHWKQHRINLIDTPGHIDFMFEVKRSLKVLDGAIVVFDGSAGVEAQTVQVWRQANQYSIPRIAFINKMDKPTACLRSSVASMKDHLKATPLVLQLPVGQAQGFRGIIDLVTMEMMLWEPGSDGKQFLTFPLVADGDFSRLPSFQASSSTFPVENSVVAKAIEERSLLADKVLTLDIELLEEVFGDSFDPVTVSPQQLRQAIRGLTVSSLAVPVLCGSSFRNIGVQPLLSAIAHYLPSPLDTTVDVPAALHSLYAYAFKVTHDPRRGPLVYLRLYSGSIKAHTTVYNIVRRKEERVTRLMLMLADEQHEVQEMGEGNIVVAVGLKHTSTGDTLVQSQSVARAAERTEPTAALASVEPPPPMFFCSVEPFSNAQQKDLEHALSCLVKEDPSLRVSTDKDTGQTVLSGMGELHLEVIHQRLTKDFKVDCSLGKLQVAYRESPTLQVTKTGSLKRSLSGKTHSFYVSITLLPAENVNHQPHVTFGIDVCQPVGSSKEAVEDAVRAGVLGACAQGPLLAFPVVGVCVEVTDLVIGCGTSVAIASACVSDTVAKALREAGIQLLEPFTELEVCVPESHVGRVLADLTNTRRAQIKEVASLGPEDGRCISALAPLACLTARLLDSTAYPDQWQCIVHSNIFPLCTSQSLPSESHCREGQRVPALRCLDHSLHHLLLQCCPDLAGGEHPPSVYETWHQLRPNLIYDRTVCTQKL